MSLQTYPNSRLNKFSQTITDYLEKANPGPKGIIKYRLLNGVKSIDPESKGQLIFPASVKIPLNGSINDPGVKQEDESVKDAGVVSFGVVKTYDEKTGQYVFRTYHIQPQKGDGGIFMLRGSVVSDMEIYEGLELSNHNASNPFRDTSIPTLFERVNDAAEAKARSDKRDFLYDALTAIRNWEPDEMRIIGASYNLSTSLSPDELKDALETIAMADPKTFYEAIDSEDTKIKAVIKMSVESGIIAFNAHENKYVYAGSGDTIATLDRVEGKKENDQFCQFLKTSANGAAIRGQLEKQLKARNKKPGR